MEKQSSFAAFRRRIAPQPVFVILGVQGAGTNLLSRIFERVLKFSLIEDGSVIFNAALRLGAAPPPADVSRAYKVIRSRLFPSVFIRKTRRLIKANANFGGIDDHFDAASCLSGADLARFVYDYGAYRLDTDRLAIKSDDIWEGIHSIDEVLPNRRIVLLTRDFRDNLLSISKADFGPIDFLIAARCVKDRFASYEAEYVRAAPAHRCHVRYEDVLDSPASVVARLSAHFGLALAANWEEELSALDVRQQNRNRWQSLATGPLEQIEAVLANELVRYGYGLNLDNATVPDRVDWMTARAVDMLKRIGQKGRHVARRLAR